MSGKPLMPLAQVGWPAAVVGAVALGLLLYGLTNYDRPNWSRYLARVFVWISVLPYIGASQALGFALAEPVVGLRVGACIVAGLVIGIVPMGIGLYLTGRMSRSREVRHGNG